MKPILSIVDGNYFVNYSSHSAILNLRGPNGDPTGALHTFLNSLWNIKQKHKGGNIIVVFDGGRAAFRNKLYPGYKKKEKRVEGSLSEVIDQAFTLDNPISEKSMRSIKKDIIEYHDNGTDVFEGLEEILETLELTSEEINKIKKDFEYYSREQMKDFTFSALEKLLPVMGIPYIKIPNEEADDVIYVLTKYLTDTYSTYCVTSDEDFVQMTSLGATVWLYRQEEMITAGNFKSKYNFDLEGFTLYKAIKGDESDKIKGVPGVGKVNATKIVKSLKEPSVTALLDFCSSSTDKKHKAVVEHFKVVKRNLRLMDLKYIEVSEDVVMDAYDLAREKAVLNFPLVKKIFYEFGLQSAGTKWLAELIKTS